MNTHTRTQSTHTPGWLPGPFERGPDQSYKGRAIRIDLCRYGGAFWLGWEGGTMAERPDDYAEEILRAVNSHAELVAALTVLSIQAANFIEASPMTPKDAALFKALDKARAALAKAQGGAA